MSSVRADGRRRRLLPTLMPTNGPCGGGKESEGPVEYPFMPNVPRFSVTSHVPLYPETTDMPPLHRDAM